MLLALLLQGGLPAAWGNDTKEVPTSQNGTQQGPYLPNTMRSLTELICNNCGLSGELPYAWNSMPMLRRISLTDNNFTGDLPHFGAWQLQELALDRNALQGWLSPGLAGAMPMLRKLSLAGCKVQGTLPPGELSEV
jgi:hypothetical protein